VSARFTSNAMVCFCLKSTLLRTLCQVISLRHRIRDQNVNLISQGTLTRNSRGTECRKALDVTCS